MCDPPARLVRPVPIDPTGSRGPTRGQAKGPYWRCTSHGFYVPTEVDDSVPEQRILEMSVLLPAGGVVTGWASLRLHGGNFFDGLAPDGRTRMPVPLTSGPGQSRRRRDGVRWLQDQLVPSEIVTIHGIRCATIERALFDAMRTADGPREAVVDMDIAAAARLASITGMSRYVEAHVGWDGVPQARDALPLADEHSRSPNETRLRLIWQLDAALPRPLVNRAVFDLDGRLLGYADLLDPAAGVVGEYDGADHRAARRHSKDVDREAGFRDHRLEVVRVTGPDLPDRALVTRRIAGGYRRASWLPESRRTWTLQPPPWWREPPCLDQVLAARERR